jgi:hypothetical protein
MMRLPHLLLPVVCLTGCVQSDFKLRDASSRPVTPASAIASPIVAEQVNEDNARRMAQALWDEIEQDEPLPAIPRAKQ